MRDISQVVIDKTCVCGIHHTHLPENAKEQEGLYWFACSCESTLTYTSSSFDKFWLRAREITPAEMNRRNKNEQVKTEYNLKSKPKPKISIVSNQALAEMMEDITQVSRESDDKSNNK